MSNILKKLSIALARLVGCAMRRVVEEVNKATRRLAYAHDGLSRVAKNNIPTVGTPHYPSAR